MKVFALGGYGKVGLAAVSLLAQSDLVTEIAIAGRNLERAEETAADLGAAVSGAKAIALHADGTDEEQLTPLLAGYDIIMNAAFDGTVLPAIRAATSTGTHYCDANVVNPQTLDPATASAAAAAGITAVVATGVSPCISNLMAVHAARQLEEVEQLQLGRADIYNFRSGRELTPRQWLNDPEESLAALREFRSYIAWTLQRLQESSVRTMRVYRGGRWVGLDPVIAGL
ncbi:MAG: saccharopine dehydrogenase NADP-binding domain-containing protein, partial [Anaerolineae bacterium]|nr:saccharopine dehydrogenase NADP-binding domain-containing protein [Anaerolineae bacterium]